MTTPARIVRLVGITGLVGWLGMIGWVAKTSQAQNGGQGPPPALPALKLDSAAKVDSKAALPPPPPIAPAEASKPAPAAAPSPVPALSPEKHPAPAQPKHDEALAPPAVEPEVPALAKTRASEPAVSILPASEANSVGTIEDPELSAQTFVERNQREAEEHLKTLTAEAEQVRTRLNKLESGIKKWENLVNALKTAQQGPVTSTAVTAGAEEAGDLEPIRPGTPGGARGEKRVKWSSAAGAGNTTSSAGLPTVHTPAEEATEPVATATPPAQAPAIRPAQAAVPGILPR